MFVHCVHDCLYHTRPENSIEAETEILSLGPKALTQFLAHNRLWEEMASEKNELTSISILEAKVPP